MSARYLIDTSRPSAAGMNPSFLMGDPARFIERITACCRRKSGYLTPGRPLAEALFRMILARANAPQGAVDLSAALARSRSAGLRKAGESVVAAVLAAVDYYGFVQTEQHAC